MRTYMRLMADGPALNILPTPAARHHRPSNLNHNSQLVKIGETPSPPPPAPPSQSGPFFSGQNVCHTASTCFFEETTRKRHHNC